MYGYIMNSFNERCLEDNVRSINFIAVQFMLMLHKSIVGKTSGIRAQYKRNGTQFAHAEGGGGGGLFLSCFDLVFW